MATQNPTVVGRTLLIAGIIFLAGCDSSRTPTTSTQITPTVADITISGLPSTLSVGQKAQLTVLVLSSDGTSTAAAQSEVSWQSSNATVASVSTSGLLTVTGSGEAHIRAEFSGRVGTARLVVSRSGFEIAGVVRESWPTEHVIIPGARVEVVGGALNGQAVVTDHDGRFALPPVTTADFYLYFKKPGYDDLRFWVKDLPRDQNPDVGLDPMLNEVFSGSCWPGAGCSCQAQRTFVFPFVVRRAGDVRLDYILRSIDAPRLQLALLHPERGEIQNWDVHGMHWYNNRGSLSASIPVAARYEVRATIACYIEFEVTASHAH